MATRGRRAQGREQLTTNLSSAHALDLRYLAAGGLLACVLLSQTANLPPLWLSVAAIMAAATLVLFASHCSLVRSQSCSLRWRIVLGLASGFVFFYGYSSLLAQERLATRLPSSLHGEAQVIEGQIASLPEVKETSAGRVQRFLFEPLSHSSLLYPLERLRVSWYRSDAELKA
ncbi:MAG: DUF4131 domain-containing protein, partial [Salinisphaeraceae bacterium]|nr:DUF4131 domain-containing protein [Salinisphaeraceae bacterium]